MALLRHRGLGGRWRICDASGVGIAPEAANSVILAAAVCLDRIAQD